MNHVLEMGALLWSFIEFLNKKVQNTQDDINRIFDGVRYNRMVLVENLKGEGKQL